MEGERCKELAEVAAVSRWRLEEVSERWGEGGSLQGGGDEGS